MKRVKALSVASIILMISLLNNTAYAQPSVEFSHERGFYYEGFKLIISASSDDCLIKYTLDGSDPVISSASQSSSTPAELYIDPYLNSGRAITPGVIVRACAINSWDTSRVETHSYIFPGEVKHQSETSPDLAPYWPTSNLVPNTYPENLLFWMQSNAQEIYLRVEPQVVHKEEYFTGFEDMLMDIPTFSLVTDPENLFHDSSGIYINATWSGREWERPGSLELIDKNTDGFQVNTGIRIRGGWSCRGDFPKHAFRLFFRKEYGDAKLRYPLFNDYGTDKFDKIDLRSSQNNSWHLPGGNGNADFIRDLYAREIQSDMGQPYSRSEYYHLYVNGNYWGLFQTQERSEARFAASYLGGGKEDYDVVKSSGPSTDYEPYTLEATDGDLNSSYALWEIAKEGFTNENYYKARGMNPDGSRNPDFPILLDEANLIDYVLIIYFIANYDGPASLDQSGADTRINNFYGIYNRENPDGFKYFIHDAESSMSNVSDDLTQFTIFAGEEFTAFNPMWLHQQLMLNTEYKQKFADRAYKHLFKNGALSAVSSLERYNKLVAKINQAIIGESARWGYVRSLRTFTKLDTWNPVVSRFVNTYFPQRTTTVINQFTIAGWLNSSVPPEFDLNDFEIESSGEWLIFDTDFSLTNPNTSGEIYYTLNGVDPRAPGGGLAAEAILYSGKIGVSSTVFLSARIKDGDDWSPLLEQVILMHTGSGLIVSELDYSPISQIIGADTLGSKSLEFVEIKNNSGVSLDMSAYELSGGISYRFPLGTQVEADSLVVIASDTAAFRKLYGFQAYGPFSGSLNNSGEEIRIINAGGGVIVKFEYNKDGVWYSAADGAGYSLVFKDYETPQLGGRKEDWRVSTNWLGSPGKDDPVAMQTKILITEVLGNSEYPYRDAIELYNPGTTTQDIGNWYLSDEKDTPGKWKIPAATQIPAGEYLVFYEGHYVTDTLQYTENEFGSKFSISSAGERLYLFSGDASDNVLEFITDFKLEASLVNTSFGNYISASGDTHTVQLEEPSFGALNSEFKKSPIIFSSLMYHPTGNNFEYIILKNRTDSLVNLFHDNDSSITWEVNGVGFKFPSKLSLAPGDSIYLVEKAIAADQFREIMNLSQPDLILNFPGKLQNSSEKISLRCPVFIESDTFSYYALATMESLEYSDSEPWPSTADGDGYALQRLDEEIFANDVGNWGTFFDVIPDADAGKNQHVRLSSPISLDGSGSEDYTNQSLIYDWQLVTAPIGSTSQLSGSTSVAPGFEPDLEGEYLFSLQVDNGERKSARAYVALFAHENHTPVAGTYPTTYKLAVNEEAALKASGCYDPDYDVLAYEWELVDIPDGSSHSSSVYTDRVFNFTPDVAGTFKFELSVNDGDLYSETVNVRVIASATPISDYGALSDRSLIYPNPVEQDLFIDFILEGGSDVAVSIMNLNGKEVYANNFRGMGSGRVQLEINMRENNIAQGIYVIKIETNEFTDIKKLIYIP